jgi:hypothetical protein
MRTMPAASPPRAGLAAMTSPRRGLGARGLRGSVAFAAIEGRLVALPAGARRPAAAPGQRPQGLDRQRNPVAAGTARRAADAAGNRRLYKAIAALLWAQARFGTFNVDPEPELELWADARWRWSGSPCSRRCASKPAWPARTARACARHRRPARAVAGRPWQPAADKLARPGATAPTAWPAWPKPEKSALATRRSALRTGALRSAGGAPPARGAHRPRQRALRRALNIMRARPAFARRRRRFEHPPLAAEGDALPPDLQAEDLQGAAARCARAAQSLQQDLDGIPPEACTRPGPAPGSRRMAATKAIGARWPSRPPDAVYDEWDYRRGAWRRDWCHLYESRRPGRRARLGR